MYQSLQDEFQIHVKVERLKTYLTYKNIIIFLNGILFLHVKVED